MNKGEILKKAISKAVDGGWDYKKFSRVQFAFEVEGGYDYLEAASFLFDHSFAKAFWGEEEHKTYSGGDCGGGCSLCSMDYYNHGGETDCCWQYHLQQLAISEDRLQYLKKFL